MSNSTMSISLCCERKSPIGRPLWGWVTAARSVTTTRSSIRSCRLQPLLPFARLAADRCRRTRPREQVLAYNFPKMIAAGARIVLGTDAGIFNRYSFGFADHHEIARYVQFGLTPAQALVASTQRPAELMGIQDMGTLAVGKSADFVILNANPLEDIRNTRQIASVYLHGALLDRDALL